MTDLLTKLPTTFQMPADLSLRIARVEGRDASAMGPIGYVGIIPPAVSGALDAVVFFPPIAWSLVPTDQIGEFDSWHDITHWTNTAGFASVKQLFPSLPLTEASLLKDHGWFTHEDIAVVRRGVVGKHRK